MVERDFLKEGTHSWELIWHYHSCPKCRFIVESRDPYEYRLGKYEVDLECGRCGHHFTATQKRNNTFGPLLGR